MSQNSKEEENQLRLRRIREFINSQQPKEEFIQDIQEEQGEMTAANKGFWAYDYMLCKKF